jgi:EAL domain-containing protein (putative c-di-GMP-specific phosphodiesterase class I)
MAAQQQLLLALGCDEAQGHLFSPPVTIDKVPDIAAARRLGLPQGIMQD